MAGPEWTVEDHLRDKPPANVLLYERFVELVSACGPYELSVSKTMIAFKGRRRGFAGARPTKRGVSGFLDLQHPVTDPRFTNVAPYTKRLFVHHFLLTDTTQLDRTFAGWVREAYEVGKGGHLAEGSGS